MKKLITIPFNALKRVEYILTIRHKVHTIYILLILIHWIYGYAFITGNQFYEVYTRSVSANDETTIVGGLHDAQNIVRRSDSIARKESATPGTEAWIRQQWEAAGADYNEVWAVIQGESGWNSDAWRCNGAGNSGIKGSKALDLGLYQGNSQHVSLTPSCALNTVCSTNWAIELWKAQGWTPWMAAGKLGIK